MRDRFSCFSDNSVSFSTPSCSTSTPTTSTPLLSPSVQNAVTCVYSTRLPSTQSHILITLSWFRSLVLGQSGLSITITLAHHSAPTSSSSFNLTSNSPLFKKNRGSKKIEFARSRVDIFWDFSCARYDRGPEPVDGFYVVVLVDSHLGLLLGDLMAEEAAAKRFRVCPQSPPPFSLLSRREHFSGDSFYKTKSRFGTTDIEHEIAIKISGETDELRSPVLSVYIDKKKVMRVKRLQWNFRGSQTIFIQGTNLIIDMFWDVHDWFFNKATNGCGIFMFSPTSGLMDAKFCSEDEKETKLSRDDDPFSLLIYATKSSP